MLESILVGALVGTTLDAAIKNHKHRYGPWMPSQVLTESRWDGQQWVPTYKPGWVTRCTRLGCQHAATAVA